jgi:hypothetical protein
MVGLVWLKLMADELTEDMVTFTTAHELKSDEQTVIAENPLLLEVDKVNTDPLKLAWTIPELVLLKIV